MISGQTWTCSRCDLRIGYLTERHGAEMPPAMSYFEGELLCLSCRRAAVAEQAAAACGDGASAGRQQAVQRALVADELARDPSRPDSKIAKTTRASTAVVRAVRRKLERPKPAPPPKPARKPKAPAKAKKKTKAPKQTTPPSPQTPELVRAALAAEPGLTIDEIAARTARAPRTIRRALAEVGAQGSEPPREPGRIGGRPKMRWRLPAKAGP